MQIRGMEGHVPLVHEFRLFWLEDQLEKLSMTKGPEQAALAPANRVAAQAAMLEARMMNNERSEGRVATGEEEAKERGSNTLWDLYQRRDAEVR